MVLIGRLDSLKDQRCPTHPGYVWWLAGFLFYAAAISYVQPVRAQVNNFHFEHLTTQHGLPGSRIYAILQDYEGFLWIGTESGVARYDGYQFVTFRASLDDTTRIPSGIVNALYQDQSGKLWVGMRDGLFWFDRIHERLVHYPLPMLGQDSSDISAFFEDRAGVLWIGTSQGLIGINLGTNDLIHLVHDATDVQSLKNNWVTALLEDRTGVLWVGTRGGLSSLDRKSHRFTHYQQGAQNADGLSIHFVTELLEDREGVLWIGTDNGLIRFDSASDTFEQFIHDPSDPSSIAPGAVEALWEDHEGTLWVGTYGGASGGTLHAMNRREGTFSRYHHQPNDSGTLKRNYSIVSIYEDRSRVLWVGTGGGYLNKLDSSTRHFVRFHRPSNQPGSLGRSYVFDVLEDRGGSVWIGTDNGLDRLDRTTGRYMHFAHDENDPGSMLHQSVRAILEDREGQIWVGTEGGLSRFDAGTQRFIRITERSESGKQQVVTELFEDRDGMLWVGTDRGIKRFDRHSGRLIAPEDPRYQDFVLSIHQDHRDVLWVGFRNGLQCYDTRTFRVLPLPQALTSISRSDIRSIYTDYDGKIWIGTFGQGLWQFDPDTGQRRVYTDQEGLPNNTVLDVLEDDAGRLWVRTLRGISRYDQASEKFTSYDEERAFGSRLNEWGAICLNNRGEFVFGGDEGLVFFFPQKIEDNPYPPQVVLTGLSLFDKPVRPAMGTFLDKPLAQTAEIRLPYDQSDLSLDFVALHFSRPEKNQYQYMLEPYDQDWRPAGTQRRATYTSLSPGEYVFRVRAANADGVWSRETTSVRIVIVPPFWMSGWFYGLCLLLLLVVIYFGYQFRVRHLRTYARDLERHVEERTQELVLEKKITEAQASQLRELDKVKSRFFANISHEFRTPLTLIRGLVEDLLDERYGTFSSDARACYRDLLHNTNRLTRNINELLDLSKLESGKMGLDRRPGDMDSFLRQLVGTFMPLAGHRGITLKYNAPDAEWYGLFDWPKLEKVFSNLLSNALKFTPEGGKVWVTVRSNPETPESRLDVIVKDTGPGIQKAYLSAIFDRFQQVDASSTRSFEGSGIGLALTKELVELHEGKILVESEYGFGSAFIVRLPFIVATREEILGEGDGRLDPGTQYLASVNMGPVEYSNSEIAGHDESVPHTTILVVEDNAELREFLRGHLEETYTVLEAEDGMAGLEMVRKHKPDLVLCDVMMPRMNGYALCEEMKRDPDLSLIPFILLSARVESQECIYGLECGADDYITKPFSARELRTRINNLIQSRRKLREVFSREIVVQPSGVVVKSEDERLLSEILSTAEEHLSDSRFGVEVLAEEIGMSRRQLHRRLHALTGESPADFIRRIRLERARQLLEAEGGTVSEVAFAVGYSSASNFSRAFRDKYDVSPSEFADRKSNS